MKKFLGLITLLISFLITSCSLNQPPTTKEKIGNYPNTKHLLGYFSFNDNWKLNNEEFLYFLPNFPNEDSIEFELDKKISENFIQNNRNSEWELAKRLEDYSYSEVLDFFTQDLDLKISREKNPHLTTLISRIGLDIWAVTLLFKEKFNRNRPFVYFNQINCSDDIKDTKNYDARGDDSYPSGHAASGWIIGLILSDIFPNYADKLMEKGYEFGQLRVICGKHWQSDVNNGRLLGSYILMKLQNNKVFKKQLKLAKKEIAKLNLNN